MSDLNWAEDRGLRIPKDLIQDAFLSIGVLNGPNLDRLGHREVQWYGRETWPQIQFRLEEKSQALGVELHFFQSNHEGALIDTLWNWMENGVHGVIVNFGGFSHSSVALRDALSGTQLPAVEVHLSHLYHRESFRHHSLTASAAIGLIMGMGGQGYCLALDFLAHYCRSQGSSHKRCG